MTTISRRAFLRTTAAASAGLAAGLEWGTANAAEFTLKYGNNVPATHPMNVAARAAAERIKTESKGRVDFQIYPNGQLGTDTDMLSQVRSGAINFFTVSPQVLGTLVNTAQINGIGFAFKDYDQVWAAMDGDLGKFVRGLISHTSIFAFDKIWDNGYRQITTSTRPIVVPADLKGLKLRVPPSPLETSMFLAFGASPTSLNFAEVYSALQTHIVDGQENPIAIIDSVKFFEVQKYCSLTNHMWDGWWFVGNKQQFARLPKDLQEIVARNIDLAATQERQMVRDLNTSLIATLKGKGLIFNTTDNTVFREKLRAAGHYSEWRKRFGDTGWALLEKYTGKLA
jgi:tripartite ATP-independent transporter DctP family solute receptor